MAMIFGFNLTIASCSTVSPAMWVLQGGNDKTTGYTIWDRDGSVAAECRTEIRKKITTPDYFIAKTEDTFFEHCMHAKGYYFMPAGKWLDSVTDGYK
jgi:hypothetical protein